MKKFAMAILGVFILLGGVLLAACEKQVSLSVSEQEVVIYTNDNQQPNYQTKTIDVSLLNSDAGINVEILKGADCIDDNFDIKRKNSETYSFTISARKSGSALLRVYSIEDHSKDQTVSVEVNTVLKNLTSKNADSTSGKSDRFVIKGTQEGKILNAKQYFEFDPVTANVCDIDWQFENESKEFVVDGSLRAKIENDRLYVYDTYSLETITLRAVFTQNTEIASTVKFDVLSNSTINNFTLGGVTLFQNNTLAANDEVKLDVKRNNANLATLEGILVVNSKYDVSLVPVVYKEENGNKVFLTKEEIDANFGLNITESTSANSNKTYNFSIDAYDYNDNKLFGDFYLYFDVAYDDYEYSVSTQDAKVKISTAFSAKQVDVYDGEKNVLNNSTFDVFSSYATGNGFKITTVVGPDDVALDTNEFFLAVDINQTALTGVDGAENFSFANVYYRGDRLTFAPQKEGSSVYVSKKLQSGSDLYISSTGDPDVLENVEFELISASNTSAKTSIFVNFYKISTDEKLEVSNADETQTEKVIYISSASGASREIEFSFKISSLTTASGLTLKSDANSNFTFSNPSFEKSADGVVATFKVTLNSVNFSDTTTFWFEHITGKKSDKFSIQAFVPLANASISNGDLSSSDVFVDKNGAQDFVLKEGMITNSAISSTTLSRLMLEAGAILPLSTNFANATLSENGLKYSYLSFEDLVSAIRDSEGLAEDAATVLAEELFSNANFQEIAAAYFRYFDEVPNTYFSINQSSLILTDNAFKGIVCAMFNGFDGNHDQVTFVRFFTLESFYSVKYLSSNVQTTLLYTTQTLSTDKIGLSRVDVSIDTRPDSKNPTYFNLDNFSFASGVEGFKKTAAGTYENSFYEISNISIDTIRSRLNFRIIANSTNLKSMVRDSLTITYTGPNGSKSKTEIQIEIKNMARIEKVDWLNRNLDNEIYLNLTSASSSERSFTISTSVSPTDAYDKSLTYSYFAVEGAASDLAITTSSAGQTFNLNINTQTGGYGNLYLLPNDVVKVVDGVRKLIVYKYSDDGIETYDYVELSSLNTRYDDLLKGTGNFDNYFLNNNGEKIYYSDVIVKISVVIADGSSEGTALRVYNQSDLESVDTAKYYRIMNNITLSGWKGYDTFSGMIFGNSDDITLHFTDDSTSFVKVNSGTIKNLTFTGDVSVKNVAYAGFIANENNGHIENCTIDVYYDGTNYNPSKLSSSATSATGGIAGLNKGTILSAKVYGANVTSTGSGYTGGLVGRNEGSVISSGIEFYSFKNADGNKISATSAAAGMVGFAGWQSALKNCYAYAYNVQNASVISGSSVAAFISNFDKSIGNVIPKVEECFAYLGNVKAPIRPENNTQYVRFVNSYLSYYDTNQVCSRIFENVTFSYVNDTYYGSISDNYLLNQTDLPSETNTNGSDKWKKLVGVLTDDNVTALNPEIWKLSDIDSTCNFGFMYLQNTRQSSAVDVEGLKVSDVDGKVLKVSDKQGVLTLYKPTVRITDVVEQSYLDRYNTISLAELFGITSEQARSLLVTSASSNIAISTNGVKLLGTNKNEFTLSVHSKMDMTKTKDFNFVIVNALPKLTTTVDTTVLEDNQTVLLQTKKSRNVLYSLSSSIYLNGSGDAYALERDGFALNYTLKNSTDEGGLGEFVIVSKSNSSIILTGAKAHSDGNTTKVNSYLTVSGLSDAYNDAIKAKLARTFTVSVYNGASSLVIENANNLEVKANQYASFNVVMATDNIEDDLVVGMKYGEIDLTAEESDGVTSFVVDSTLTLEVSWAKTKIGDQEGIYNFAVLVKIKDSQKHLISRDYDNLKLFVNAKSQENNNTYVRSVNLTVRTQGVESFSISTYRIDNRFIRNSVLYMTPSSNILTSVAPSTDAIVALNVSPVFAKMTHFTLTYSTVGQSVGTVSLSKLAYNSQFGYYVNSSSTVLLENGIRVNLTEYDKKGDGVFYFRIYISSQFASNSGVTLTATFFDGSERLTGGNKHIEVDYLQDAVVRVNEKSTLLLAKGETATVTVRVDRDQELYSLYLENNERNILLSSPVEQDMGSYKINTATLTARVNATLEGGKTSGIFYVCASVQRMINNVQEIKVSRATVCLVDFAVDADNISVQSSGATRAYNGKEYDVVYAYINETQILNFNYPVAPSELSYDRNNPEEVEAVNSIMQKRNEFAMTNNYADERVGYFINYRLNENVGLYQSISLKEQLWYASDENNSTSIYNANYDTIQPNSIFTIERETLEGKEMLSVTGIRSGVQLMKLQTRVIYQGTEFVYDYYFLVVVEVYSNEEENLIPIETAKEFVDYATESELAGNYILMNDIVLEDYEPLDTDLISSLDGNGYTIHINSFAKPTGSTLNLALFDTVNADTTLKNIRVNIYGAGQISVNVLQYTTVNIAGFAITNNGVIYNCEVVSYYDSNYQISTHQENGIMVSYTRGENADPEILTDSMISSLRLTSQVAGFAITNTASIVNSRVGGDSFKHIVKIAGTDYVDVQALGTFTIMGQGDVAGFVCDNQKSISACFAKQMQIYNQTESDVSKTAGFALTNSSSIQGSYVEGVGEETLDEENPIYYNNLTNINSIGIIAGFIYENNGLVKNSYANIAIENSKSKGSMVAGFVYRNNSGGEVTLCYAACEIAKKDSNQMQFSGVSDFVENLNEGKISLSYFYNDSRLDDTSQTRIEPGALAVNDIENENSFYGFSFSSGWDELNGVDYNGIWKITDRGIGLVSADERAFSNRYAVTVNSRTTMFYNKHIMQTGTMQFLDLSYGKKENPIIIRNARDFARATGKQDGGEVSAFKEFYSDSLVFGSYRLVNDIDMSEIGQSADSENEYKLRTTEKTFLNGLLDGNGFTISGISLGSSKEVENFGLFAKIENSVIMNLSLIVESVHDSQANIVGTLAGTAIDSRILAISLSPVSATGEEASDTAVHGNNVVGGIVGMLFGQSKLSDISISDIYIFSALRDMGKNILSNKTYTGAELRESVENGSPLKSKVQNVSYAGAVAGYVDIYDNVDESRVSFSTSVEVSSYDIVTVHVSDSVNIYGEVAGGLFGYVGCSTLVYDATLVVDANMNLSNPSYITSKNLFAGGIIGENYGGLFAVSASYEDSLQETIERNENAYYSGTSSERGQQSIFSKTPSDEEYTRKTNEPMFVGGLVGYMGGGYIYIGYNKLNVISHSTSTVAVGGIIGLAGYNDLQFDLPSISKDAKVNIHLQDVYASGDVYVDAAYEDSSIGETMGFSGGIIGALEKTEAGQTSVVSLKNVLAQNYYSFGQNGLVGDTAEIEDGTLDSDKHFTVIGRIYKAKADAVAGTVTFETTSDKLTDNLYVINSDDRYTNAKNGFSNGSAGSLTVGGYKEFKLGNVDVKLNTFGFESSLVDGNGEQNNAILYTQHIGSAEMSTMAAAYARNNNYFLENGWEDIFWKHTEEQLFPHIELLPKLNVIFWDYYNTEKVLQDIANSPSATVVVRGKVSEDENDTTCADIDLRELDFEPIKEFRGNLVSYNAYMQNDEMGVVSPGYANTDGKGGAQGDRVGIITSKPLFESVLSGAVVEGLSIYITAEGDDGFNLVSGTSELAIFRSLNLVLNNSLTIKTKEILNTGEDTTPYGAGIITTYANSCSFINIKVTLRKELSGDYATLTFKHKAETAGNVYMGVLAGEIVQTQAYNRIVVQGIQIVKDGDSEAGDVEVNFEVGNKENTKYENLYVGLYAGQISKKQSNYASTIVSLSRVDGVVLNINDQSPAATGSSKTVYAGGYAGKIDTVDAVSMVATEEERVGNGLKIVQKSKLDHFVAGIGFGEINAEATIYNSSSFEAKLVGKIEQMVVVDSEEKGVVSATQAQLGGLAGISSSNISISGFSVDFSVGKLLSGEVENTYEDTIYVDRSTTREENIFDRNKTDYDVSPFLVEEDVDNSVGGLIGYVNGGKVTVSGQCNLEGTIDIANTLSVGGFIGKITTDFETNVSGTNNLNIAVRGAGAYVGGLVGNVAAATSSSSREIAINASGYQVLGTLLSNAKDLKFGGAIGYVGTTNYTTDTVAVDNVHFGGAVKVYGKDTLAGGTVTGNTLSGAKVSVGGVVGEFSLDSGKTWNAENSKFTISNCISYGDVFVNYKTRDGADYYNYKLNQYNFGGIVGKASAVKISKCVSIMTNFNSRLTNAYNSGTTDASIDNIGAIFGSGSVVSENNVYSSGVCLAYQREAGNTDLAYGSTAPYYGYTTEVGEVKQEGQKAGTDYAAQTTDILDKIREFGISTQGLKKGHKLNPYVWSDGTEAISEDNKLAEESYHGISWFALKEDISIKAPIADTFANSAFVGNGHTITSAREKDFGKKLATSTGSPLYYKGGIVDTLGANDQTEKIGSGTNDDSSYHLKNFSILSGFVVDLDIQMDLLSYAGNYHALGGVAGQMYGESFIYGVGVQGNLSGGGNGHLQLAGIAGYMGYGYINECYVDADITYRANTDGLISGIANCGQNNTTIRSTYSSGLIETYNQGKVYTFAYANGKREGVKDAFGNVTDDTNKNSVDIIDCYSITQIKEDKTLSNNGAQSKVFVSEVATPIGNVVNGCYDLKPEETGGVAAATGEETAVQKLNKTVSSIDDISVGYTSDGVVSGTSSAPTKYQSEGYSTWYFTPFTNYGYASHGFGWLKNVTAYTRTEDNPSEAKTEEEIASQTEEPVAAATKTYSYSVITYSDVLNYQESLKGVGDNQKDGTEWYLGVVNQGKFEQMYSAKSEGDKQYRFFLRYGFDMSKFDTSKLGTDVSFSLDGNNKALDFTNAGEVGSGLFGTVSGDIYNLRVSNINTSGAATLATTLKGNVKNVVVTGTLKSSAAVVGGVVGTLNGSAENVDSLVNITADKGGIVGGVVGKLEKPTTGAGTATAAADTQYTISNCSNSGMIIVTGAGSTEKSFTVINHNKLSTDSTANANAIAGGVVGYMDSGTSVTKCYNTNAVLVNFTDETSANSIAGGVAGYAIGNISSSYNTGFVGAGNYSSESFNLAGGIFGYGSGMTVSSCINDGAVQAINKMDSRKTTVTATKASTGTAGDGSDYVRNPDNVTYEMTITYNPGNFRQVYAYGLGYGASVTFNDNYTSTNNIKNDGNIGEFTETQTLTLNRSEMIANNNGALPFYAKFKTECKKNADGSDTDQLNIYCNGYDSYGNPMRVYLKDTMTRIYATNDGKSITKEGATNVDTSITKEDATNEIVEELFPVEHGNRVSYLAKFNYNEKWTQEENRELLYDGALSKYGPYPPNDEQRKKDYKCFSESIKSAALLSGTTTYASYATFSGYDAILKSENGEILKSEDGEIENEPTRIGLVGADGFSTVSDSNNSANATDISSKIAKLEADKESKSEIKEIVVNGENKIAVVSSGDNLKSILAPNKASATVEMTLSNISEENWNRLSEKNFKVGDVTDENETIPVQYYNIRDFDKSETDKTVTFGIDLYFNQEVTSKECNISITYTSQGTATLGLNNMIYNEDEGETWILLSECYGRLTSDVVTAIKDNGGIVGDNKYSFTASVGGTDITSIDFIDYASLQEIDDFKNLSDAYASGLAYLEVAGDKTSSWNGKNLNFTLTTEINRTTSFDTKITTESGTATFTASDISSKKFEDEKTYLIDNMSNFTDIDGVVTTESERTYLNLEKLRVAVKEKGRFGKNVTKLAFGSGETYVNYQNYNWSSNLTILGGQKIDITDLAIGPWNSWEINSWTIYFENPVFSFEEKIKNESTKAGPFTLTVTGAAQAVVDGEGKTIFNVDGTLAEGITLDDIENGDKITKASESIFGVNFYTLTATFDYAVSKITLQNNSSNDLGYTLSGETLKDGASAGIFKQGYLSSSGSVELAPSLTSFTVDYLTTNKKIVTTNGDGSTTETDFTNQKFNESSVTLETIDESDNVTGIYEISNGTEDEVIPEGTFKNLLKGGFVSTEYSETSEVKDGADTLYATDSYSYKIYENGTISVEYRVSERDKDGYFKIESKIETDENGNEYTSKDITTQIIKFVYDPTGHKLYRIDKYGETGSHTETDEDGKTVTVPDYGWLYDNATPTENPKSEQLKVLESYGGLDVKVIASYLSENEILFAKNAAGDLYTQSTTTAWEGSGNATTKNIELHYSFTTSFGAPTGGNVVSGMFEYSSDGSTWADGTEIVASDFESVEYTYRYQQNPSVTITGISASAQNKNDVYKYVLLEKDISLGVFTGSGFTNSATINGNNFALRYINNDLALLSSNTGAIKNLKIVTNSSLADATGVIRKNIVANESQNYFVINETSATISDVDLYGNIRNIGVMKAIIKSLFSLEATSPLVNTFVQTYTGTLTNISSHIAVNGLDAADAGKSVAVKINDSVGGSGNVIIAGNGANGANGETSRDGGSGGVGGSITVQDGFTGYARAGIGGFAGFGGNGVNGYYNERAQKVYGGGKAGKAGDNGSVGTFSGSSKLDSRSFNEDQHQLNGNGGAGGVGLIIGNKFYSASTNGTVGKSGNDGATGVDWKTKISTPNNESKVTFGPTSSLNIIWSERFRKVNAFKTRDRLNEEWKTAVNTKMGEESALGCCNSIYYFGSLNYTDNYYWPFYKWQRTLFPSGEVVNGYSSEYLSGDNLTKPAQSS